MPRTPWLASIALLLVILGIYHSHGVHFVFWADSSTYLGQAMSIAGSNGYDRGGGRSVGYPLMLAPFIDFPAAALVIVGVQALIVLAGYVLLYRHMRAGAKAVAPNATHARAMFVAMLPIALVATTSYSSLQVFTLSLLPEVLFLTLAMLAVAVVARFVLREPGEPGMLWQAALAAAVASLPALVKPHWMLAAPALVAIVAARAAVAMARSSSSLRVRATRAAVSIVLAFGVLAAVTWPERYLSATHNVEASLFGPRTLFCNHMHMIDDALTRRPGMTLHADPAVDGAIRQAMTDLRARDSNPWKLLGFNGDLCNFDEGFRKLLGRLIPSVEEQRQFFVGSYMKAAEAEPIRFAGKITYQILAGLYRSFEKFDFHVSTGEQHGLSPRFTAGTTAEGEAGPLGSRTRMKSTAGGLVVRVVLGTFFYLLLAAYLALIVLSCIAAPYFWRSWPPQRQRAFVAFLGVPIAAVLSHHALVAITHSFDIWRYAFGVFLVNIGFIGMAALFWLDEKSLADRLARLSLPIARRRPPA